MSKKDCKREVKDAFGDGMACMIVLIALGIGVYLLGSFLDERYTKKEDTELRKSLAECTIWYTDKDSVITCIHRVTRGF